jgi:hypothetical protein
MILPKWFLNRRQITSSSFGQLIKYKIRTSSFVIPYFSKKAKKKVRNRRVIRGAEFDDVNFSIKMRAAGFKGSDGSISYAFQPAGNAILFFAENRVSRSPIPTGNCLNVGQLRDIDIGAFGICKWKVDNTYVCTNAPNHIVTLDLNDTALPQTLATTPNASAICNNQCAACDMVSEVCQPPSASTFSYA